MVSPHFSSVQAGRLLWKISYYLRFDCIVCPVGGSLGLIRKNRLLMNRLYTRVFWRFLIADHRGCCGIYLHEIRTNCRQNNMLCKRGYSVEEIFFI